MTNERERPACRVEMPRGALARERQALRAGPVRWAEELAIVNTLSCGPCLMQADSSLATGGAGVEHGDTMLVHTVYFWLKPDLTETQRADFRGGVESLVGIKAAEKVYVGSPAKTAKRPVVDDSYAVALTVVCQDVAAHDAYQVDPIHLKFVEQFKTFWTRVQIYDAQ